jgi:DNA primase
VDRVGPCSAKITLEKVEDVRDSKRKRIIDRAVALLRVWEGETSPGAQEITDKVTRETKSAEITRFEGLPAGPAVQESDTIIVVEGRADVLALLRAGIKNVVAVEGTSIPPSIIKLAKTKEIIAFLDGDRGGDLILKELSQVTDIKFVARAPTGREVEELTTKEIAKALRNKVPASQITGKIKRRASESTTRASASPKRRTRRTTQKTGTQRRTTTRSKTTSRSVSRPKRSRIPKPIREFAEKIQQTMTAIILDKDKNVLKEIHVAELATILQQIEEAKTILLDGVVTQRLVDIADERGVTLIIGARIGNVVKRPVKIKIHTFNDL